MLTQRLVQSLDTGLGTLTITCDNTSLTDLQDLHAELRSRAEVRTEGTITTEGEAPPLPPQ